MTRTRLGGVPNQPKTPQHSFRCRDELWAAAKQKAAREDRKMTDVLTEALEQYVADDGEE